MLGSIVPNSGNFPLRNVGNGGSRQVAPTTIQITDGLDGGQTEDLGLLPKQLLQPAAEPPAALATDTATPEPSKPEGFDPEFDARLRKFKPGSGFVSADGTKALIRLESFAESDGSLSNRDYLPSPSFWVDLQEGRADQVIERGFSGTKKDYQISYEGGSELETNGPVATLKGTEGKTATMRRLQPGEAEKMLDSLSFMSLPKTQEPAFLAKLPDDRVFLVTQPKYGASSYDDNKAYIGTPGSMQQVEISSYETMRDGGTTTIETEAGTFYSPSPFRSGEATTFNGEPATRLPTHSGQNADVVASLGVNLGEGELRTPIV